MFVLEHWKQFTTLDTFWKMLISVFYSLVGLFALVGNLMVIYYLHRYVIYTLLSRK